MTLEELIEYRYSVYTKWNKDDKYILLNDELNEDAKTMSISVDLSKCQEYKQNKVMDKRL